MSATHLLPARLAIPLLAWRPHNLPAYLQLPSFSLLEFSRPKSYYPRKQPTHVSSPQPLPPLYMPQVFFAYNEEDSQQICPIPLSFRILISGYGIIPDQIIFVHLLTFMLKMIKILFLYTSKFNIFYQFSFVIF